MTEVTAKVGNNLRASKLPAIVLICQLIFIILFALFGNYHEQAEPTNKKYATHPERNEIQRYSSMFMDTHVMVFLGFGFLMTFLKRYGYSSVSYTLLIASLVIQWALIVKGLIHSNGHHVNIGIKEIIGSDFAAAVVLISFGAVLGKTSPAQMLVMAIIEVPLLAVNEHIGVVLFKTVDVGGSMYVHAFGAYFGLAVTRIIFKPHQLDDSKEGPVYHSDLFAMIGTVFLWIFWPSFNAALAVGDEQHRAIINTYLSLVACVLVVFAFSALLTKEKKFDMVHIQNATLAGGVAVGAMADLNIGAYGALLVGAVGGFLSVVGYVYITPFLCDKLKIHDTCGVHNLHGLPGVMAAIGAVIACSVAQWETYGRGLFELFPQRAPAVNQTIENDEIRELIVSEQLQYGDGRTASGQAGYQMAALCVTLVLAIGGGLLAGIVMALPIWDQPNSAEVYNDDTYWTVAPEWASTSYTVVRETEDGDKQLIEMKLSSSHNETELANGSS